MGPGRVASAVAGLLLASACAPARADETSSQDRLRILYSSRFAFAEDGQPLVTVEIMSGQSEVHLSAPGGLEVLPDGLTGATVSGQSRWRVVAERARPGVVQEWITAGRHRASAEEEIARELKIWRERGFQPRRIELGSMFAVAGERIDNREVLVGVLAAAPGRTGAERARIARQFGVQTGLHRELAQRPEGLMVAQSGPLAVRNPGMLWFQPRRQDATVTVEQVTVGRGGAAPAHRREDRRYWGAVYVAVGSDGRLTVVNAVPAEKLLAGLVPAEMFPEAASAALRAQAIAARSDLLHKIGHRHRTEPFLLCSSQHCQVYSGAGHEHPRTSRAVAETRGLVLLDRAGFLVDARYSAACGGHGEHNDIVWGDPPDPALRGHFDGDAAAAARWRGGITEDGVRAFIDEPSGAAYCAQTPYSAGRHRWRVRIPASALDQQVAAQYPRLGHVRGLEAAARGISGRIVRLQIHGQHGSVEVTGELAIRRLLGGGLKSSLFYISSIGNGKQPDAFEFRGAGFGHGVGMCQVGAIGMAMQGLHHEAILAHYYLGSRLRRLY
jgi:SpoIID/LytB domain protein